MDILLIFAMVAVAIGITIYGRAKNKAKAKAAADAIEAAKPENRTGWHIGPWIAGYGDGSPGMPRHPTPQGNGWFFDFPTDPNSHVHYVQLFKPPALVGAKQISMRFTVTGGGFVPQEFPDGRPATVCLIIQRKGDNWGAQGEFEAYRLYSSKVVNLAPGEFELTMALDYTLWGGVMGSRNAAAFDAALREVDNIALGFGSAGGRGHGVYATQPSRFTLLDIQVVR